MHSASPATFSVLNLLLFRFQTKLITLPYNLLLHPDARASLNVSFKDSIIIIDEAHNLIDTILSTHTVSVTSVQISQAGAQIDAYLSRFRDRLKGSNEMHLREVRATLTGLERFCARWVENAGSETGNNSKGKAPTQREEIITAGRVVEQMGGNLDQINVSCHPSSGGCIDLRTHTEHNWSALFAVGQT